MDGSALETDHEVANAAEGERRYHPHHQNITEQLGEKQGAYLIVATVDFLDETHLERSTCFARISESYVND